MVRYFFNLAGNGHTLLDDKGIELCDPALVHDHAVARAEVLKEQAANNKWTEWRIEITDEFGRPVLVVPISDTSE